MKKIRRIIAILLAMSFAIATVACAAAPDSFMGDSFGDAYHGAIMPGGDSEGDIDVSPEGAEPEIPDDDADSEETDEEEDKKEENDEVKLPSGMITAGAWVDNDNYQLWLDLFEQGEDEEGETTFGKFNHFLEENNSWGFNSLKRVKVNVTCGESAVAGATVIAYDNEGETLFSAVSDAQGNAYLFVSENEGRVEVLSGEGSATAQFSAEERELFVVLESKGDKLNVIELMFVVDVTGSMGDEISFLKAELADVIKKISATDSELVIKLAFLFYRDLDDKVPFYYCDFMDVTDPIGLELRLNELESQYATGGGDTPEAVDEALKRAVNAQWSTGATTKIIYHVLDAPAHNATKYREKFNEAVLVAAEKGVRVCPILCSGADTVTEYTMREAAIHTGGTFIFVTDDSGIGNSHHDPELPNITVELLNSMLVRLTKGYHTGEFEDPVYWKQDPNLNNK